jgi:hypothetical protein
MKPPAFMGGSWNLAFGINVFIIVFVVGAGIGFGGWAATLSLIQNFHTYKLFANW